MNFIKFRNFKQGISLAKLLIPLKPLQVCGCKGIHQIYNQHISNLTTIISNTFKPANFLTSGIVQFIQICGMKQKGYLNLQCKHCHFVMRHGRQYIVCKSKASHKRVQPIKKLKNLQILTFASQKKICDW